MESQFIPNKNTMETILKYWPIITVVISCIAVGTWQSVTWALDIEDNQTAIVKDVNRMDGEVKKISDVQVDINKLNVSNAKLQSDVKHINESIQRTEMIQQDTNALLREVIKKQSEYQARPEPVKRAPSYERERYEPRFYGRQPAW